MVFNTVLILIESLLAERNPRTVKVFLLLVMKFEKALVKEHTVYVVLW